MVLELIELRKKVSESKQLTGYAAGNSDWW